MFPYWFGPSRKVELFRRIPSISISVRNPVNPRMYGDPWPCGVFWIITLGISRNASGTVRDIRSFCIVSRVNVSATYGTQTSPLRSASP